MPRRHSIVLVTGLCITPAFTAYGQDFNGNSIRDAVDIRSGTSVDCNHNGVPDEADVSRPDFAAAIEHSSDSATLTNVTGVAPADVDLDGDMDLIVASRSQQNNSSITIWRNDGGPGLVFGTRQTVANAICHLVRTADLNADGRADIIACDAGFAQVVVMLATGPGAFAAPTTLPAGSRGTGLAVADLDNDGDIDLAMPGVANNMVNVFRNNGNGTFAAFQEFPCGQQPVAVAAGDFTGDGLPDLAVANSFISAPGAGTVSLLRNAGGGSFIAHATITVPGHAETSVNSAPHDVALSDINADGDADLLVSSKDSNSLQVFSNDGVGTFSNTQTIGPLESIGGVADRFICANLDADPALEIAWSDSAAHVVRVYDNQGGQFALWSSYAAGSMGPVAIAAADFTGDGRPDFALAGDSSYAFSIMVGLGELRYDAVVHIRRPDLNFYPLLADFTGDGLTDLASYATFDLPATFRIAPGLGGGRFGEATIVSLPSAAPLLPRDVDADGDLDILGVGNSGNRYCELNNGDGTFGAPIFSSQMNFTGNVQTADINNDGHMDMLWTRTIISNQPSFINISLGDGQGNFAPSTEFETPPFLGEIWTGDLTGDGYPEIFAGIAAGIVAELGLETFIVYPNNADGTFGNYTVYASELAPNFAGGVGNFAWVDIDGDGDKDLLAASTYTWLWRNNNHQLAAPVQLGGFANYIRNEFGPCIVDIDADGNLDFYGSASVSGIVSPAAFFNDGTGGFGPRLAVMRYRNSSDARAVGDADNNGRPDILVKIQGFGDWYLHLTAPSTVLDCNGNGIPNECEPGSCGSGVPGDVNGDGQVNVTDLLAVIGAWGSCQPAPALCPADFNHDGLINVTDLLTVIANWG